MLTFQCEFNDSEVLWSFSLLHQITVTVTLSAKEAKPPAVILQTKQKRENHAVEK